MVVAHLANKIIKVQMENVFHQMEEIKALTLTVKLNKVMVHAKHVEDTTNWLKVTASQLAKIQNVIYGIVKNNVNAVIIMIDIIWIITIFVSKRILIAHK
jgi:hypothetical protein